MGALVWSRELGFCTMQLLLMQSNEQGLLKELVPPEKRVAVRGAERYRVEWQHRIREFPHHTCSYRHDLGTHSIRHVNREPDSQALYTDAASASTSSRFCARKSGSSAHEHVSGSKTLGGTPSNSCLTQFSLRLSVHSHTPRLTFGSFSTGHTRPPPEHWQLSSLNVKPA